MQAYSGSKKDLLEELRTIIGKRLEAFAKEKGALQASRDQETKSTVGDKYETGRSMVQLELDKLQSAISDQQKDLEVLSKIEKSPISKKVGFGSLVRTKNACFLIGLGWGIRELSRGEIFLVSIHAPLADELVGRKKGEEFIFKGEIFSLLDVE